MKRLALILAAAGALTLPARAQLFTVDAFAGAFIGSLIGGAAASDCHHGFSGQGAAIGAGIGFVAGALVGQANRHYYEQHQPVYYSAPVAPVAIAGYGYGYSVVPVTTPVYVPPPAPAAAARPRLVAPPAAPPMAAHQIADAPRVPDAPSF